MARLGDKAVSWVEQALRANPDADAHTLYQAAFLDGVTGAQPTTFVRHVERIRANMLDVVEGDGAPEPVDDGPVDDDGTVRRGEELRASAMVPACPDCEETLKCGRMGCGVAVCVRAGIAPPGSPWEEAQDVGGPEEDPATRVDLSAELTAEFRALSAEVRRAEQRHARLLDIPTHPRVNLFSDELEHRFPASWRRPVQLVERLHSERAAAGEIDVAEFSDGTVRFSGSMAVTDEVRDLLAALRGCIEDISE